MKLHSVHIARSVWFFHLNDLNPNGKSIRSEALPFIVERYGFPNVPTPQQIAELDKNNQVLEFSGGSFGRDGHEKVTVKLTIGRTGVMADSRSSTSDTDSFLEDFFDSLSAQFGLRSHRELSIRKLHNSILYVALDEKMTSFNANFQSFCDALRVELQLPEDSIEVGSVAFWIDPQKQPQGMLPFRIERQENVPFSENRYFALAPLRTEKHIELLTKLEQVLLNP